MAERKTKTPNWLKLDNAAKIYPAASNRNWQAIFRLSISLKEKIDETLLHEALNKTLIRMPYFSYSLKKGIFWAYLEKIEDEAKIYKDNRFPFNWDNNKANPWLFRLKVHENRIALETKHVLCDATGAMYFITNIVANYLSIKYRTQIPSNGFILNPKDRPRPYEWEDSFLKHARKGTRSRKEDSAYKIIGTNLSKGEIIITNAKIPIDIIKTRAKEYSCTINAFLSAVLLKALLDLQEEDGRLSKPVKLSIPVNLRKYYKSKTFRNFSAYFNIPIHPSFGQYSLEDLIKQVKAYSLLETSEQLINARMNTNVIAEKNPLIRLVPLFMKNAILKIMYNLTGERYFTLSISNLGLIHLPDKMNKYIEAIDFIPGPSKRNKIGISVVGHGNTISINVTRTIEESRLEQKFLSNLVKLKVPVLVECNRR